jgi:hypothetical protein
LPAIENTRRAVQLRCHPIEDVDGNTFGRACTVFRLGWLASADGNLDEAVQLLHERLRLT